jgi:hypothetical protein
MKLRAAPIVLVPGFRFAGVRAGPSAGLTWLVVADRPVVVAGVLTSTGRPRLRCK